jgi:hypothetical protein
VLAETALRAVSGALAGALDAADPLPIRRDGRRHVVADPRLSRDEALAWLFEGRANPPESRFRPDPLEGLPGDRQRRFLFEVTADEFVEARPEFRRRYLLEGPGWTLRDRLPDWLPPDVRDSLVELEEAGAFRRLALPNLRKFPGRPPWGEIVVWAGLDEFRRPTVEIYNYAPEKLDFYEGLPTLGAADARLLWYVYTSYNADMRYFVEDLGKRPSDAREELQRIWGEVFKGVLEGAMYVVTTGAAFGAAKQVVRSMADDVLEAALASFRNKRQLFSLWARQQATFELVLFRGTTWKRVLGDLVLDATHDLGRGTYFSPQRANAAGFAPRHASATDPGILLRLKVRTGDLGETLDLVDGPLAAAWNSFVAPILKYQPRLVNEQYNRSLSAFLASLGKTMDDYDAIIARDYLNGGTQVCIKKEGLARRLLDAAEEVPVTP